MERQRKIFLLVLAVSALMSILVLLHVPGVNGPSYWTWQWVRLKGWRYFPLMLAAAGPFFLAQYLHGKHRLNPRALLPLVMLSTLLLQLIAAGMHKNPFSLSRIAEIVQSPLDTSYFTDAASFMTKQKVSGLRELLGRYPQEMPRLTGHSRYRPPGPILYYSFLISLFGVTSEAALVGGLIIAVLAASAVFGAYWLIQNLCGDAHVAFCGASFFALSPSLVLFFPEFDQVYALLSCSVIGCWIMAVRQGSSLWAIGYGLALALALFFSYIFLILGAFLGLVALTNIVEHRLNGFIRVARCSLLATATFVIVYLAVWWLLQFDPVATFRTALITQELDQRLLNRPYPTHLLFDALDFALGAGWIALLLAGSYLLWPVREKGRIDKPGFRDPSLERPRTIAWLCVAEILIVVILGLLPGETARLWLPLQPFLLVPVALELCRWPFRQRIAVYASLWVIMSAIGQNMLFIA